MSVGKQLDCDSASSGDKNVTGYNGKVESSADSLDKQKRTTGKRHKIGQWFGDRVKSVIGNVMKKKNTNEKAPCKMHRRQNALQSGANVRGRWRNHSEYLLSSIGLCVGLGNVWRFPTLCYQNGGGAFLVPYFTATLFMGVPLFYLESALGQFTASGMNIAWARLCPAFKGIGWACIALTATIAIYYNTIISWCCIYLLASFRNPMPWTTCRHVHYASKTCYTNQDSKGFCGPSTGTSNPEKYCEFQLNGKSYKYQCDSVSLDPETSNWVCSGISSDATINLLELSETIGNGTGRYWNESRAGEGPHWVHCDLLNCTYNASRFFADVAPYIGLSLPGEDFFEFVCIRDGKNMLLFFKLNEMK